MENTQEKGAQPRQERKEPVYIDMAESGKTGQIHAQKLQIHMLNGIQSTCRIHPRHLNGGKLLIGIGGLNQLNDLQLGS